MDAPTLNAREGDSTIEPTPAEPKAKFQHRRRSGNTVPVTTPDPFYSSFTTCGDRFTSLDVDDNYKAFEEAINSPDLRNFVVDYGDDRCFAATNLAHKDVGDLLLTRPERLSTRWIAFFKPNWHHTFIRDLMRGKGMHPRHVNLFTASPTGSAGRNSEFMDLVSRMHHWYSVEMEEKWAMIGHNKIYFIRSKDKVEEEGRLGWLNRKPSVFEEHYGRSESPLSPNMLRLWQWIVLFDDGTVVSFHEPVPGRETLSTEEYQKRVTFTRRKLLQKIQSLCLSDEAQKRRRFRNTQIGIAVTLRYPFRNYNCTNKGIGEAGRLMFYLFDDWDSGYMLLTEQGTNYYKKLNELKHELHRRPSVHEVERLYQIARELSILKRLYESYIQVCKQILKASKLASKQGATVDEDADALPYHELSQNTIALPVEVLRPFEMLKERYPLYVFPIIDSCLEEQNRLVELAYNVINLHANNSIGKLTLITMLFLPISFVISYFSVNISDLENQYSKWDVWGTLIVVLVFTVIFILWLDRRSNGFGRLDLQALKDSWKIRSNRRSRRSSDDVEYKIGSNF